MLLCFDFSQKHMHIPSTCWHESDSSVCVVILLVVMPVDWSMGNVCMDDVKEAVKHILVYPTDLHSFHEAPAGPLSFVDMPTLPFPAIGMVKCFIDINYNISGEVPIAHIKECLQSKNYNELPGLYGFRKVISGQFKLDLAILPMDNGNHTIIKLIHLHQLVKVATAREFCQGESFMFDWKGEVRVMKKCIHFMFEKLGGFQCRHHIIRAAEEGKPEVDRSQEEWDFGFDFIEEKGPRDNTKNRQLRWITTETAKKDSPIYHWPAVLVEKSLRNLSQDGVLAQVHTEWPLTLYDIDVRILKALAPLFPTFSEKALGLHGEPGVGKTPVARSVAMAMSRYHIRRIGKVGEVEPSFRQASEFDFFRGQSGTASCFDCSMF